MYGEFEILHKVTNEILSSINNEILATNEIVNTSTETQRPPTLMEAVQTQNAKEQEDNFNFLISTRFYCNATQALSAFLMLYR